MRLSEPPKKRLFYVSLKRSEPTEAGELMRWSKVSYAATAPG